MKYKDLCIIFIIWGVLDTIYFLFMALMLWRVIKNQKTEFYRVFIIIFWLIAFFTRILFYTFLQISDWDKEYNYYVSLKSITVWHRFLIEIPLLWYALAGVTYSFRWITQYSFVLWAYGKYHKYNERLNKNLQYLFVSFIVCSFLYLVISMWVDILSDQFRIFLVWMYIFASILLVTTALLFLQRIKRHSYLDYLKNRTIITHILI